MPETEADRIIRARREERDRQERIRDEELRKMEQQQPREPSLDEQFKAEVFIVLQMLAELNYPYMEEITVQERTWLGRRTKLKAAWQLDSHSGASEAGGWGQIQHYNQSIYLLSDGRICQNSSSDMFGDGQNIIKSPARYLSKLVDLRKKLEAMKNQQRDPGTPSP